VPSWFRKEAKELPYTAAERTAAVQFLIRFGQRKAYAQCLCFSPREEKTKKQVKQHYRRLALLVHPDKHAGENNDRAKLAFQLLLQAYEYFTANP